MRLCPLSEIKTLLLASATTLNGSFMPLVVTVVTVIWALQVKAREQRQEAKFGFHGKWLSSGW